MGAPKAKLAVSMAPTLVRRIKSVVGRGRAKSVSAYIEHAVAAQLAAEAEFDVLLADALAGSGGAPSAVERARARRILRGAAA